MKIRDAFIIMLICAVSAMLNGCATSQPSKFYVLNALEDHQKAGTQACRDSRIIGIGITPVDMPKYLDRPQIMTRVNGNELNLSEFHLWAEPLKSSVSRILVHNLSALLCATVEIYPWAGSERLDYRVSATVIRLDGTPGGQAFLDAQWAIFDDHSKKLLVTKESRFNEPVGSNSYEALVSAYSRALASLSREIADAFTAAAKDRDREE
jgi:hypothetical protein